MALTNRLACSGLEHTIDELNAMKSECEELNHLCQENETLRTKLKHLSQQHLADTEKARRQHDIITQARQEASRIESLHLQETTQLYNRINDLQLNHHALSDEQVADRTRKLAQNLDYWVKSNFRDVDKLASFQGLDKPKLVVDDDDDDDDGFPRTSHQRRALIQARILGECHFGRLDEGSNDLLAKIECEVERNCSENTLRHWRLGTSLAIDSLTKDDLPITFAHIIDCVETLFAQYASSTDPERRKRQLLDLLRRCADLKMLLRRQGRYGFTYSVRGEEFGSDCMAYVGGKGQVLSLFGLL